MFAEVYIDAAASASDKIYTYRVPEELCELIRPAMRVIVPFGRGSRLSQAFVVSLKESVSFDESRIKDIFAPADASPAVPPYLMATAVFLRNRYFCSYGEAMKCVLPSADKLKKITRYFRTENGFVPSDEAQAAFLSAVSAEKGREMAYIRSKTKLSPVKALSAAAALVAKGALRAEEEFVPENREMFDEYVSLTSPDNSLQDHYACISSRAVKQREVVKYLLEHGGRSPKKELYAATGAVKSTLDSLEENNLIVVSAVARSYRRDDDILPYPGYPLTAEQAMALKVFREHPAGTRFLLHGVTGSGKTHLFFEMFSDMLKEGKQCLLLVPEISLTPQMARLVESRFGEQVAVMHSALTSAQRYSELLKIKRGEARIVLGARSALFMPFSDLGMIVIDEEHESSYKSSSSPRYDTVETAEFIAGETHATLLLSSATPSTDIYRKALAGEYVLLELTERVNKIPLPPVDIADMREELKSGNRSPISMRLEELITDRLDKKEQVMLFLNRRGFNTYVFCRECGYIEKCPNCDVSLTYHSSSGRLRCHYCGYEKAPAKRCPKCGSDKIRFMGTGTEKIETAVREMFHEARVLRLDSDTASKAGAYDRILGDFAAGRADILIGTQMIVKGLDFDNVTLMGILLAESSLSFPDVNAAARTFQLVEQAAGRAGRRSNNGMVVLQTYMPDSPVMAYAANHDYRGFYSYDINYRMEMGYPPFSEILGFFAANESEERCRADAEKMAEAIKRLSGGYEEAKVYPPTPSFITKINNRYIYHVLVKMPEGSPLHALLRDNYDTIRKGVSSYTYAEINPTALL